MKNIRDISPDKDKKEPKTCLITIAYDGSDFAGWATQPNKITVQGCIETILSRVFQKKINILAASRTDKGVHAREQKFTLRLNLDFSAEKLFNLLRKTLSKYILIKRVQKVDSNFHPLCNVVSKEYRYFINTGKHNIWQKKYRWEYNLPIDIKKLNDILQIFQGRHNFFNYSYCRWPERNQVKNERAITALKCWKKQNIIVISIKAKNFLRYQIRAIIGEVIDCYEGKQNITNLQEKLINFDKKGYKYKNLAPAGGLYLWKIDYER
ncbi:tRNA pseudouridine synthase A [endosymbiont DhMRE of Dentiscutata heterogama]|uniref:tRNA pseudouridine(38-40) synthase TruA n=1 Tax=endosymbiont DhMRE of Dentiscutata heterogama TaxID=1609546 RepID=UPI000629D5AF|nr:tRNA pseudouridine(38-40) synthase TruA [endosymbiont DhMRE of Dentiscutata heterogama]CFW92936.1 tRNA pseudouridine synthase A [endosymbiont DhMRE of Dentiscutata heterogama]